MRKIQGSVAALGVVAVLGLGACSSGGEGPVPGPSRSPVVDASCGVAITPGNSPSAVPSVAPSTAGGKVGVILPAAASGAAPGEREGQQLARSLEAMGLTPEVWSSAGNQKGYVAIARSLIADGAQVLVVGAAEPATAARVERVADHAGVAVVEYGGVVLGGTARYEVSFDYEQIGRLQAQTMLSCLEARGVTDPRIILVNGGTDVNENAVLLDIGAHQVLDPWVAAGSGNLEQETTVPGWSAAGAAEVFSQALDASGGRVDGVLAADDDIADAVVGVLRERGLDDTVVTGSGAGTRGLRNVALGRQTMTVHTNPEHEADAAAQLAAALVSSRDRELADLPLAEVDDPLSPRRTLMALWVPGRVVTRDTVPAGWSVSGR